MWRVSATDREGRVAASLDLEEGELTIGRDADRQLVLPSASVSRRHAKIVIEGEKIMLVDEQSANGVMVNGARVGGPTAVTVASQIAIADFALRIERLSVAPARGQKPAAMVPTIPPSPVSVSVEAQGPSLRLISEGGPYGGQVFDLPPGEISVGRSAENALVFDDPSLSRKHARLNRRGQMIDVEDLGSSNGTLVNGRKIGQSVARPGDTVRFGELQFRLEGDLVGTRTSAPTSAAPTMAYLLIGGGVVTALLMLLAVVGLLRRVPPTQAPGREGISHISRQGDQHLRAAQNFYVQQRYDSARSEVEAAIQDDPASTDALSLKKKIIQAPEDDRAVISAKGSLALGDRKGLDAALRTLEEVTPGSAAHNLLAGKLVSALERYGNDRCQGRAYPECAWAICRAFEVAPPGERPTPRSQRALEEAEKRLKRDASFQPCRYTAR